MGDRLPRAAKRVLARGHDGLRQAQRLGRRVGKRVGVAVAGGAVTLAGGAMLVLPGPGILTVALGLAILSLEFERPRGLLAQMKARGTELKDRVVARKWLRRDGS